MDNEIGGFAEEPEYVSDALTEEEQLRDFECFNYCLAEEYVGAMYTEDFEAIGEIDSYLFGNICKWINYDEKLGNKEVQDEIKTGTLITKKGRTFLEAIAEKKQICFAELYTSLGVYDPRVIVMLIEEAGKNEELKIQVLLNLNEQEKLDKLYADICSTIETNFLIAKEDNNDIRYLRIIKNGVRVLFFPKKLDKPPMPSNLTWTKYLKRTTN